MPKITTHGGASNARTEIDPAAPSSTPLSGVDGPTVELTRAEDPHAPAGRPGEHVVFFAEPAGGAEGAGGVEPEGSDGNAEASDGAEDFAAPAVPAKRAGRKGSGSS